MIVRTCSNEIDFHLPLVNNVCQQESNGNGYLCMCGMPLCNNAWSGNYHRGVILSLLLTLGSVIVWNQSYLLFVIYLCSGRKSNADDSCKHVSGIASDQFIFCKFSFISITVYTNCVKIIPGHWFWFTSCAVPTPTSNSFGGPMRPWWSSIFPICCCHAPQRPIPTLRGKMVEDFFCCCTRTAGQVIVPASSQQACQSIQTIRSL